VGGKACKKDLRKELYVTDTSRQEILTDQEEGRFEERLDPRPSGWLLRLGKELVVSSGKGKCPGGIHITPRRGGKGRHFAEKTAWRGGIGGDIYPNG